MSTTPTLSVIVPATDSPTTLPRCVAAIRAAAEPPEELIVVDGPAQLSASGARNQGAARATGDVLVFVDADVEVHADAFGRIREAFAGDPALTAVCGSYDDAPAAHGTVSVFRNLLHHHVHQGSPGPAETFWTGLGAIRRDHFRRAGGFDEVRFPHPSIEDIELGHRLHARGAKLTLDPAIQGTHLKAWTLRSMLWTDFARRGVPWVRLQLRSRRATHALNCGWRHRISAAASAGTVLAAVLGRPLVALAATATLLVANRTFYALLHRRLGPIRAVAGVALHGLHHLVAVAAVGTAVVAWIGSGFERSSATVETFPTPGTTTEGSLAG